jgi:hypothetical protein
LKCIIQDKNSDPAQSPRLASETCGLDPSPDDAFGRGFTLQLADLKTHDR